MHVTMETAFLMARSFCFFHSPFSAHFLALLNSSSMGTEGKLATSSVHDMATCRCEQHMAASNTGLPVVDTAALKLATRVVLYGASIAERNPGSVQLPDC